MDVRALVKELGRPYSAALGVDLRRRPEAWFLAAILYAKPIREETATRTYRIFEAAGRTTATAIAAAGWDELVRLLDAGGYVRYDFSTATKLLEVFGNLQRSYGGSLHRLHAQAKDSRDLEARLRALGPGIGPVTVSIFLRDMRRVWRKADPAPSPLVRAAMRRFKVRSIRAYAQRHRLDPVRLETALLRWALGRRRARRRRKGL